mmetsp:Transcript_13325/g.17800  ORF Transcript_13325/g.17800 Transcript_13325/m.17800 type:complete len:352 (-) Transcript_13325:1426-2481(-)
MSTLQLPPNWERCCTCDGRPYYKDHNTRTTHWYPPPCALHAPADRKSKSMDEIIASLVQKFPSWEEDALRTLLESNGNDETVTTSQIISWTQQDIPRDHVPAAKQEKVDSSPPDDVPLSRHRYDAIMAKRLSSRITPSSIRTVLKAVAVLKQRAQVARTSSGNSTDSSSSKQKEKQHQKSERSLTREERILQGKKLLGQRLEFLGLRTHHMADDGNCQFRAISFELYNSQEYHLYIRAKLVEYLRAHADTFAAFVGDQQDFLNYLDTMAKDRSWGDELTLQACCDCFSVDIHVITTESSNYHLNYHPAFTEEDEAATIASAAISDAIILPRRKLFLSYISPVHYNVVAPVQ